MEKWVKVIFTLNEGCHRSRMSLNWRRIKSLGHILFCMTSGPRSDAKVSCLPSAGRLLYWHQQHISHRYYKMFLHTLTYKTKASKRRSEPSTYSHILNIRVHHQTSAPFPPTFTGFFFTWNLCACLRRFLIFHFPHTPGLPCMFKTDLWVSKHLILSSEGAWFQEVWLHCQTTVVPGPNGRLTKPARRGASATLFTGQHYPLQNPPKQRQHGEEESHDSSISFLSATHAAQTSITARQRRIQTAPWMQFVTDP